MTPIQSTIRQANIRLFQWGIVAVSFLFFYYAAFGCTWGMVPWVYQAEINSLSMRSVGAAAATATNWVGFFLPQFVHFILKLMIT